MPSAVTQWGLAGLANMCAATVTNPVDVVKTRMQMQGMGNRTRRYRTTMHCLTSIVGDEGIRACYRGLSASLLREGFYSGLRMGMYEPAKELLGATDPQHTPLHLKILAGALTGACGSALANPADLVKVRMQTCERSVSASARSVLADVIRDRGVLGLWRGCGPTVQRAALLTASQIPSYDHCKHTVMNAYGVREGAVLHFGCCMFAGVVAALVTAPVDLAKTRVMNCTQKQAPGTLACLLHIARSEGPLALYKGFNSQWLRIGPHTCVSLMVFEKLRALAGMKYL
eukprot:TRINITY_DN19887_c0_g1_i1.p1 TRINITY_DN19887_c0_g1~~TRINITY_DN19887_c0_g1_i1.p1  ORF type:complete len:286 (+),score=59.02 TRINITY_DN19887_c0_g1_i1:75-932(+)